MAPAVLHAYSCSVKDSIRLSHWLNSLEVWLVFFCRTVNENLKICRFVQNDFGSLLKCLLIGFHQPMRRCVPLVRV